MLEERRKCRSSHPIISLKLWFDAAARQSQVYGFIYTDADGRLIATNIPGFPVQALGALVPRLARRGPDGKRLLDTHPINLSVLRLGIGPEAGLLSVLGDPSNRATGLERALPGVRRILAERLAAQAA
jgi:hypothetical protein